jgi:hypothetical protein
MTIDQARQLSADDLAVGDEHVAQAETEAHDARQLLEALERMAVEADKMPKAAPVVEARQLADFAARRAAAVRAKADRARAAQRLLALDQLATELEAFGATVSAGTGLQAALSKIADDRDEFLRLCGEHNQKLGELRTRASALGATSLPMSGVLSAENAYVHIAPGGGLRTGTVNVSQLAMAELEYAISLAASGSGYSAVRALGPVAENYGGQR